jgi:hypothetical protein
VELMPHSGSETTFSSFYLFILTTNVSKGIRRGEGGISRFIRLSPNCNGIAGDIPGKKILIQASHCFLDGIRGVVCFARLVSIALSLLMWDISPIDK